MYNLRKSAFSDKHFIDWDIKTLEAIYNMYGKGFYTTDDGFSVCTKINDTVYVKELFTNDIIHSLSQLNTIFNAKEYIVTLPEKSDLPNAMIFGKHWDDIYFNLAMD